MSGPAAHSILKKIFRPRKPVRRYLSHRLYLGFLYEPESGIDVDEVFCVIMDQPWTYTRENVAEVYCHGGAAAQRQILTIMLRAGAQLAEPGEFTKRAFLNGRIDLSQAESVLDIIESETALELETALSHVKGRLSGKVEELRSEICRLLAEAASSSGGGSSSGLACSCLAGSFFCSFFCGDSANAVKASNASADSHRDIIEFYLTVAAGRPPPFNFPDSRPHPDKVTRPPRPLERETDVPASR